MFWSLVKAKMAHLNVSKRMCSKLKADVQGVRTANNLIRGYIEQNNIGKALEVYRGIENPNLATVRMMAQSYIRDIEKETSLMERKLILRDLQKMPQQFKRCENGYSYLDKFWGLFLLDAEIKTYRNEYKYDAFIQLISEYDIAIWSDENADIPTLRLLQFTPQISEFVIGYVFNTQMDKIENGLYIRYKIKVTNRRAMEITSKEFVLKLIENVYKMHGVQFDEQTLYLTPNEIKKLKQ